MDKFECESILCYPSWCKKHRIGAMLAKERMGHEGVEKSTDTI